MANFIDRRLNAKGKSTVNRQRFINRYKQQIKKAVSDAVTHRSVTDVDKGEKSVSPPRTSANPYSIKVAAASVSECIRATTNLPAATR